MRKKILLGLMMIGVIGISGCEAVSNIENVANEKIKGTEFTASVYDSYGSNTLNVTGKRISLDVMDSSSNVFSEIFSDETDTKYISSVLDVTIDGEQMLMVGDTVIFAEKGLDRITNFQLEGINSKKESETGFSFLDRSINKYKNVVGKSKIVVISSQLGVPIGVYQGNKVYVEVPDDLPKTTRLSIDGKSLYIHRANYQIIDSNLIS